MVEVEKLALENRFDYLLIESSGISEPLPVAQTFSFVDEENGIDLSGFSRLDTLVTVVDAYNFFRDFGSSDTVFNRALNDNEEDQRSIVNLITDQLEFANVIVINKSDMVNENQLGKLKVILSKLNPDASIVSTAYGVVDPGQIMNTRLFDLEKASGSMAWKEELAKVHKPETEEYGISTFVFQDKRPFHPKRFWDYINDHWPANVIRSKGLFYLASRFDVAVSWSQAGGSLKAEPVGVWWASMPFTKRINFPAFLEIQDRIEQTWDKRFGDRMNELVIIGQDLDETRIKNELGKCLLNEQEINILEEGGSFPDNWPF